MNFYKKSRVLIKAILGRDNARSLISWYLSRGESKFEQLQFPTTGVVYDVGGYLGDFAQLILRNCQLDIWVFEPNPDSISHLSQRFNDNARVHLIAAALGGSSSTLSLSLAGRASTLYSKNDAPSVDVPVYSAPEFIKENNHEIALMKLNIEGAEYELLNSIIQSGIASEIHSYLIQFHLKFPDAREQYQAIAENLQATHKLIWRYPFLWEYWVRK